MSGYYDNNFVCRQCSPVCAECVLTAEHCFSCRGDNRSDPPLCQCRPGFYENANRTCVQCNTKVCTRCSVSATNCTECRELRVGPPDCPCKSGYY